MTNQRAVAQTETRLSDLLNRNSERIPRRFCLTAVVLPVGSASAAQAAGLASESKKEIKSPYGRCEALPWAEHSLQRLD